MKKIFTLIVTLVLAISLQARDNGQFFKQMNGQNVSVTNVEQRFAQWFSLPEGTEWREVSRTTDFAGMERIEYRQFVAGVEVEHSQILIHAKDGKVTSANGMVMEARRSPARIRQHRALLKNEGRQLFLVNAKEGFRYAYKEMTEKKDAWVYRDAETLEEIKRVPVVHRLSADEGTPVQVGATSLYSGNVMLDASKAADGSTYLYDAQRNIHTLNAAYIPELTELFEIGKIWDYFPQGNLPEDLTEASQEELKEWTEYISDLIQNNGLDKLPQLILDYGKYITNKPDTEYSAYKIKNITLYNLYYEDENGELQPFTPKAEFDPTLPIIPLNFRMNYGVAPEPISKAVVSEINIGSVSIDAFPFVKSTGSYIAHLPSKGGTLYVLTPIFGDNSEEDDSSEDDDDIFKKVMNDDDEEDEEEDDEEIKYDTLAVVSIVPDATGKVEFSNERLSFSIEYEKAGDPAADIHWGMAKTLDFYKEVYGRNSFDDKGAPVYNLLYNLNEKSESVLGYESVNAGALDTNTPYPMLYGMGGISFPASWGPVVELSVMAHEFTHLITDQTAKLEYKDESGALNESFSDVFGITAKKYCKNSTDWYIGEGMLVDYDMKPMSNLRDMSNPKNSMDGNNPAPDTYEGENWVEPETDLEDHGGVHNNSSVQNKMYYLLTDGDKGTNDKGQAYNVEGIGIEKSRKIAYLTLTSYATMESDYAAIRKAWQEAAVALYGANGKEVKVVADAWDAVGVEGDDPTGLDKMYVNEGQAGRIFDLQGRMLNELPTESGIYIVDGKKVFVK